MKAWGSWGDGARVGFAGVDPGVGEGWRGVKARGWGLEVGAHRGWGPRVGCGPVGAGQGWAGGVGETQPMRSGPENSVASSCHF